MNKGNLIEEVAKVTCSKKEAGLAVDATLAAIQKALKKGNAVTLVGFGTFGVKKRKARTGRNPQTGKAIKCRRFPLQPAWPRRWLTPSPRRPV